MKATNTTKQAAANADAADAVPATDAKQAPAVVLRCRILAPTLTAGGGVGAKNAIINLHKDAAEFHEGRGEVEILGTL